jgi:integrase
MIAQLTVTALVEQFLTATQQRSAASTYRWYAAFLRRFAKHLTDTPVDDLTADVVNDWIDLEYGNDSDSARHGAARAVVRMLNYAVNENLLAVSPLKGFVKPSPSYRLSFITVEQYQALRQYVQKHTAFRTRLDVLDLLWHTGCRPQELRIIRAEWVSGSVVTIPREFAKGKRKERVILLNETARAIVKRLSGQWKTGPIVRNHYGSPMSQKTLGQMLARLGERVGVPGLCAYQFRHTFITRLLENGESVVDVAAISGNSVKMVSTVYNHVGANPTRLLSMI